LVRVELKVSKSSVRRVFFPKEGESGDIYPALLSLRQNNLRMMPPTAGSTADEVLSIALGKLAPRRDEVFADIGCGSGKVGPRRLPPRPGGWAIDRRPEAIAYAREQRAGREQRTCSLLRERGME
jgi:SAM-dependent methyltransferase